MKHLSRDLLQLEGSSQDRDSHLLHTSELENFRDASFSFVFIAPSTSFARMLILILELLPAAIKHSVKKKKETATHATKKSKPPPPPV